MHETLQAAALPCAVLNRPGLSRGRVLAPAIRFRTFGNFLRLNPLCRHGDGFAWCRNAWDKEKDGPQFQELDVDSKGGLGGTSTEVFGPPAMLLIGFTDMEVEFFNGVLRGLIEGEEVGLVSATQDMMNGTLKEAFEVGLLSEPKPGTAPLGIRRTAIFSGLYTQEVLEVIYAYREQHDTRPIFAAAVPNNWNTNLRELVEEIFDDDRRMNPDTSGEEN